MTPSIPIALAAGVLSFLSPCVLPLVPSYLAYLGGDSGRRGTVVRNSLLFVLGFSLVFIALGASASLLGAVVLENRSWLMRLGGLVVIAFGLMLFGLIRIPFLYRTARPGYPQNGSTPLGALLMGMSFAIGWTPCIGPVLGAILTLAGASGTLTTGAGLLGVYALGLAIPFLLASLGLGAFTSFTTRFRRFLPWVERISGGVLVVAGLLMFTGYYTRINAYLIGLTPRWLLERL
ncbi:MAG: cytochrome c biogenesis protein CcdA [Trueperaceae bacterium]